MNSRARLLALVLAPVLGIVWMASAQAAVIVSCNVTTGGIAFGVYSPLSTVGTASTGALKVTCTGTGTGRRGGNVTAILSLSTGLSGNYASRTMFSATNVLNYNIYWNTAYNQIVGDGTGGSSTGSANMTVTVGNSAQVTNTVYGYIPPLQNAAAGGYTDVITVTVTY
jgi:spore coat protein U-like protein